MACAWDCIPMRRAKAQELLTQKSYVRLQQSSFLSELFSEIAFYHIYPGTGSMFIKIMVLFWQSQNFVQLVVGVKLK